MIRLRFVLGRARSSRLIAWFSSAHLSHVDVKLPNGKLLGARSDNVGGGDGVLERPDPYEEVAAIVYFEVPGTPQQEALFYRFLADQLGKPYDRLSIIAFFLNRNWRDEDAWICSELVAAGLEYAGIMPTVYLPVSKITPVMLATLVSELPGARQVH